MKREIVISLFLFILLFFCLTTVYAEKEDGFKGEIDMSLVKDGTYIR